MRGVAMDTTEGLRRGTRSGQHRSADPVPVGEATLGPHVRRIGPPIDGLGEIKSNVNYPIHRPAPKFEEQTTRVEVFETG